MCGPNGRALDGLSWDWASVCLYWSLNRAARSFLMFHTLWALSLLWANLTCVFIGNIDGGNENKCSFDRKHIAGKAWGYFSNPGLPPLSLSVSVLKSGSCWLCSSCKVPLFHLMLKYEYSTSHNPTESLVDCKMWTTEPSRLMWFPQLNRNYKNKKST